jgi:S-adenosylmethionine hydrolase
VAEPVELAGGVVLDPNRIAPGELSRTFHGRDLFAPAAARLAGGATLEALGDVVELRSLTRLPVPAVEVAPESVRAPVLSIDHFGNCRTLIPKTALPWRLAEVEVRCGRTRSQGIRDTYGEVQPGAPLALFGSHGGLELAVRDGSAAAELGIRRGDIVEVRPRA